MGWRERLEDLPPEQRLLIEGGSLSQRFANRPLGLSHPAFIGGFYGFLVSISLLLPLGYENGWNQDSLRDWGFLGILLMLIIAITGHFSLIISKILRRPPTSLRRGLIYPMPFIGLSILSVLFVTNLDSELSEVVVNWIRNIGWGLLLAPGPIYVHLSWAPRWRLLCRLEEGLDPFEGNNPQPKEDSLENDVEDFDMEMAIGEIEEDPPSLYANDGEE